MIANGSFETAGAFAYRAANWTTTVTVTTGVEGVVSFAEFAVDDAAQGTDTAETFESGWGAFIAAFEGYFIDLEVIDFDGTATPEDPETFESGWGAAAFASSIEYNLALWGPGGTDAELFDQSVFSLVTDPGDTSGRLTELLAVDGFETGWGTFDPTPDPTDVLGYFTLADISGEDHDPFDIPDWPDIDA